MPQFYAPLNLVAMTTEGRSSYDSGRKPVLMADSASVIGTAQRISNGTGLLNLCAGACCGAAAAGAETDGGMKELG